MTKNRQVDSGPLKKNPQWPPFQAMADDLPKPTETGSRHGEVAIGTVKFSGQVPESFLDELRDWAKPLGPQAMRFSYTAAIGVFLALPEAVRREVFDYIQSQRWQHYREVEPAEVARVCRESIIRWARPDAE